MWILSGRQRGAAYTWSVIYSETEFLKAMRYWLSGFETDRVNEFIESLNDPAVERIEGNRFIGIDTSVLFDGFQNATGQWRIEFFEQLQEDHANAVSGCR